VDAANRLAGIAASRMSTAQIRMAKRLAEPRRSCPSNALLAGQVARSRPGHRPDARLSRSSPWPELLGASSEHTLDV
jgi:hypothetical protein